MDKTQFYKEKTKSSTLSGLVSEVNLPTATVGTLGVSSPDGTTITITSAGVLSASTSSTTLSGDVTGTLGATVVSKINGVSVSFAGPLTQTGVYSWGLTVPGAYTYTLPSATCNLVGRGTIVRGARLSQKSTTGATTLMCGLGSTMVFTPTTSGKIKLKINVIAQCLTAATSVEVYARYGTGTAPSNSAASTGTAVLSSYLGAYFATGSELVHIPIEATLTGLTVGTTYWVDLALRNGTGAYAQYATVTYYEFEEYV